MPTTAEQLLVAISRVVAKYPNTIVRCVINFPNHYLIFIQGEKVIAQLNIETGDLQGEI